MLVDVWCWFCYYHIVLIIWSLCFWWGNVNVKTRTRFCTVPRACFSIIATHYRHTFDTTLYTLVWSDWTRHGRRMKMSRRYYDISDIFYFLVFGNIGVLNFIIWVLCQLWLILWVILKRRKGCLSKMNQFLSFGLERIVVLKMCVCMKVLVQDAL